VGAGCAGACADAVPGAGVGAGAAGGATVCPGGVCAVPGRVAGGGAPAGSDAGGALAVWGGCGAAFGLGGIGRISHTPPSRPTTMRPVIMSVPALGTTDEIGGAPVERDGGRAAGPMGGGAAARADAVAADAGGAVRAGVDGAAGPARGGAGGAADATRGGGAGLGGAATAGLASAGDDGASGASVRDARQHSQRVALGLLANPQYGQAVSAMDGVSQVAGCAAPCCWRPVYLKTCAKQWPVRPQCGPRLALDRARR